VVGVDGAVGGVAVAGGTSVVAGVVGTLGVLVVGGGTAVTGGTAPVVLVLARATSFFCLSFVRAPIAKPAPTPRASTAATPAATQTPRPGARL
jgi:hypothetical protein